MRWQHLGLVLASALLVACSGELVVDQGGGGGGGGGADAGGGGGADAGGGGSMARQFFDDNVAPILGEQTCTTCHGDPPLGAAPVILGDGSLGAMYDGILSSQYVDLAAPANSTFLVEDGHDGGAAPGFTPGQSDTVVQWLEMEAM